MSQVVQTSKAPAAIGSYSQAMKVGQTVYLAGQIPLDANTMLLVEGGIENQVAKVFENISLVAEAAGGSVDDIVKLTVYLLDLSHITIVNQAIATRFKAPYPARTSIGVAALPKNAAVEIEAIMVLNS